jgi:hypothetical protein
MQFVKGRRLGMHKLLAIGSDPSYGSQLDYDSVVVLAYLAWGAISCRMRASHFLAQMGVNSIEIKPDHGN